ncbi:MAG: nucleotide exchange factor GrpE [Alphaproteobacteria bacterium]
MSKRKASKQKTMPATKEKTVSTEPDVRPAADAAEAAAEHEGAAPNAEPDTEKAVETETAVEAAPARDAAPATEIAPDPAVEIASLKDQLLRAMAETENLRRRSVREREEVGKYAVTAFARDLLTVADNLRRALDSVPVEVREDDRLAGVVAGVEMIEREFLSTLERHGIRRLDPLGKKFDHNFHQAMVEIADSDQPAGTVVDVMQAGYTIADRLLRPAMVAVAKGEKAKAGVDTEA